MDHPTEREVPHLSDSRPPTIADLGPHSSDSISSALVPYSMNEDSGPKEGEIQDPILEQMETEEEDLPLEEATSKLIMGLHVGPANYQPPP